MKKRRWYRKKRMWILLVIITYLITIQMEWARFRYDPQGLKQMVAENTQMEPLILQKDFEGKSMQYFQVGENIMAPVIAFVHGSPGSLADYKTYLADPELAEKSTMISIDRLGFGFSDFGTTEPSLSMQAKSIASILKPFKNNKIILVGHSLGGPVIAKIAMDFPHLIDASLLIAPSISPEHEPSNAWRKILNWKVFQWLTPPAMRVCNQEIIPLKDELEASMEGWENIKTPVTVIQGENDRLVPKGNADFAKKMLTNSASVDIQIVKEGNHFILWSETKMVKNAILDLLKKID